LFDDLPLSPAVVTAGLFCLIGKSENLIESAALFDFPTALAAMGGIAARKNKQ